MSPTLTRSDWNGLLKDRRPTAPDVELKATLQKSSEGGSGAFLGLADDRQRYWIKTINNAQGERVPITEQIVGRIGSLINAPTCSVKTIGIDANFVGWEFKSGNKLEQGIAHASLHVEDAVLNRALDHRSDDDNVRRHAFIFALYDWCWGGDIQGLLEASNKNTFYSHDHGWYLPPNGAQWNIAELEDKVDTPHEMQKNDDGKVQSVAEEIAVAIEAVQKEEILEALSCIPSTWPVSDDELECVGFFLEKRTTAVAERIRMRFRRSQ